MTLYLKAKLPNGRVWLQEAHGIMELQRIACNLGAIKFKIVDRQDNVVYAQNEGLVSC